MSTSGIQTLVHRSIEMNIAPFFITKCTTQSQIDSTHIVCGTATYFATLFFQSWILSSILLSAIFHYICSFNCGIWVERSNMPASFVDIAFFYCCFLFRGIFRKNWSEQIWILRNFKAFYEYDAHKKVCRKNFCWNWCSKAGFY